MLNTDNEELLEISLDSLRDFVNKKNANFFTNNSQIINQIKRLYYNSNKPTQIILIDLINKINKFTENKLTISDL